MPDPRAHRPVLVLVLAVGAGALSGCLTTRYQPPPAQAPPAWSEAPTSVGGRATTWVPAQPSAAAAAKGPWWTIFRDPTLDRLEQALVTQNPAIQASFEALMAARAQVAQARAGYYPTLALAPSVTRSGAAGGPATAHGTTLAAGGVSAPLGGTSTTFQLPLAASWEPDLWGRVRATVQGYAFAAQVSAADLANERLSEETTLALDYCTLCAEDSLQVLADRIVGDDRALLAAAQALVTTGIDQEQAVASAEQTLAAATAAAAQIGATRAQYAHAIATLLGRAPAELALPALGLTTPVPSIPVLVPSQLLERRPDIAAAERTLAEANAQLQVAQTAFYPSLSLSASAGLAAATLPELLSAPIRYWSIGASLSETLFDAGLRRAAVRQFEAQYREDLALYRQTVLAAFQQVEDALANLRQDSVANGRAAAAVTAATRARALEQVRVEDGIDPPTSLLSADITELTARQTLIQDHLAALTAAVQLVAALGGGWRREDLPASDSTAVPATP